MKLAWLTDIHLNFINVHQRQSFYQQIIATSSDAILISGDIAEAPCLVEILMEMTAFIQKPLYFILGNHDYYRDHIQTVREKMVSLTQTQPQLFWLPAAGPQRLSENVVLVGGDGWADGRLGDYQNSRVTLNDSRLIVDLLQANILGAFSLLDKMQQLADADAHALECQLRQAVIEKPKKVMILTHVPPFQETCLHQGKISDQDWLPYFSSKVTGDILINIAEQHPLIEFLVLCGHTHSTAYYQPLQNLVVKAGAAEYGKPVVQEVFSI